MKILFTGGGTAGHIFPIIAIAREIRRIYSDKNIRLSYIGPRDEFGKIFLSHEHIAVKTILAGKIRRDFSLKNICQNLIDVLFKIPIGFLQTLFYIFFFSPDLIFGKGGYGSIPAVMVGWVLRVPIFLHESDIAPGLSNKLLSKYALEIFVAFPKTEYFPLQKMFLVGNPIRKEILEGSKEAAKKLFKLSGEKPVILILGGSQGAKKINDTLLLILPELLTHFELIHQAGEKNLISVKIEANAILDEKLKKYYHLFDFIKEEQLKHAYQISNLIVSRAGAGGIFEIAALGKPSILIPIAGAAQNHQFKNAYAYAKNKATIVIEETNFTSHFFLEKLKYLLSEFEELEKMSQAAKAFSQPRAAKIIASYIVEYLNKT